MLYFFFFSFLFVSIKKFHDAFISDKFHLSGLSLYIAFVLVYIIIEGLTEDMLLSLNVSPYENKDY